MPRISLATPCLLALLAGACGGATAGPPKGEDYTPVNTPDRATACAAEQDAAKVAREEMVGEQSPEMRERTASAVFAHAECEHAAFAESQFGGDTQDEIFEQIRGAREQYFAARNLYTEVITYGSARYVHAGARLGDLHLAYASKLRAIDVPAEIDDPTERQLFTEELASLAADFDAKAALAYSDALALAESALTVDPDGADIQWTAPACDALAALDRELWELRVLCAH